MNLSDNYQINSFSQKVSKEYLLLNLRMSLNKELLEQKVISFPIFNKMQELLIKKMNRILLSQANSK